MGLPFLQSIFWCQKLSCVKNFKSKPTNVLLLNQDIYISICLLWKSLNYGVCNISIFISMCCRYASRFMLPSFTCHFLFQLTNAHSSKSVCLTWTAACSDPDIENGNTSFGPPFSEGDSTQVVCNPGSRLEHNISSTLICRNFSWGYIPRCIGKITHLYFQST